MENPAWAEEEAETLALVSHFRGGQASRRFISTDRSLPGLPPKAHLHNTLTQPGLSWH